MLKQPADEALWHEFRTAFTAFVVNDVQKSLEAGVEVGTIILTTIGLECLSGYYAGRRPDQRQFVRFIERYLPPYTNYAGDLYVCVRNGLMRDYALRVNPLTERSFFFKRDAGEEHLVPTATDRNVIYLNRATYARDFLSAQARYLDEAENNPAL